LITFSFLWAAKQTVTLDLTCRTK